MRIARYKPKSYNKRKYAKRIRQTERNLIKIQKEEATQSLVSIKQKIKRDNYKRKLIQNQTRQREKD